jgi:hypothetical protein
LPGLYDRPGGDEPVNDRADPVHGLFEGLLNGNPLRGLLTGVEIGQHARRQIARRRRRSDRRLTLDRRFRFPWHARRRLRRRRLVDLGLRISRLMAICCHGAVLPTDPRDDGDRIPQRVEFARAFRFERAQFLERAV